MIDGSAPLWQASAVDIAKGVAVGQLRCADTIGAAVDRMRQVNGHLNAVVHDLGDQAVIAAEAADKRLASGEPARPRYFFRSDSRGERPELNRKGGTWKSSQ